MRVALCAHNPGDLKLFGELMKGAFSIGASVLIPYTVSSQKDWGPVADMAEAAEKVCRLPALVVVSYLVIEEGTNRSLTLLEDSTSAEEQCEDLRVHYSDSKKRVEATSYCFVGLVTPGNDTPGRFESKSGELNFNLNRKEEKHLEEYPFDRILLENGYTAFSAEQKERRKFKHQAAREFIGALRRNMMNEYDRLGEVRI